MSSNAPTVGGTSQAFEDEKLVRTDALKADIESKISLGLTDIDRLDGESDEDFLARREQREAEREDERTATFEHRKGELNDLGFKQLDFLNQNTNELFKTDLEGITFGGAGDRTGFDTSLKSLKDRKARLTASKQAPGRAGTILTNRRSLLS